MLTNFLIRAMDGFWLRRLKKVLSGSGDIEPERVVRRLVGHTRPVIAVSWSPDSRRLVSASIDRRH